MSLSHTAAWDQFLGLIKDSIGSQSFTTWFQPIHSVKLEEKNLLVEVPNHFFCEWLEGHYNVLMNQALLQVLGENAKLSYTVANGSDDAVIPIPSITGDRVGQSYKKSNLMERYTFENFVEGANNDFARAAATRDRLKTNQQTSHDQRSAAREQKRLRTEVDQVRRDDRQRRCTKAREQIQSLDHHMPIYYIDETGNRVFLDDQKRADLIAFYHREEEMFCK